MEISVSGPPGVLAQRRVDKDRYTVPENVITPYHNTVVSSVKEMIPRINHAILDLAVSNLIVTDCLFAVVKNRLKQLLD